jgi:hypothetical protein
MAVVRAAPTDAATMERALRFANIAMFTIAQQRRRLRSVEPEDERFALRWWADFEFMITALRRMRRAAELAAKAPSVRVEIQAAIAAFDAVVPGLLAMRNVAEHIEDYAVDDPRRRLQDVDRGQLEVSTWGATVHWLGRELNLDDAFVAASTLLRAMKDVTRAHLPSGQTLEP